MVERLFRMQAAIGAHLLQLFIGFFLYLTSSIPRPESLGRALAPSREQRNYLPDELVRSGCRHQTDSLQPEKNSFLGRGKHICVGPRFSSLCPTERAHLTSYLMEMDITVVGGGHMLRTNPLLLCGGMCKRLSFVLI